MLSKSILKNSRNGAIKYMFFQELMELSTILKFMQGSSMPCPGQPDLQASGNIVLQLVQHIHVFNGTSFILTTGTPIFYLKKLHEQGIATVGTVRSNRLFNCKLSDDKSMKKKGREQQKYGYLVLIMWSYEQSSGLTTGVLASFQRTSQVNNPNMYRDLIKKASKCVNVSCPLIVTTYNQFMGGVDLLDGLLSFYRIHIRSKKLYHKLIYHFLTLLL